MVKKEFQHTFIWQRGATLIVAMIILLLLTIIGLASMSTSNLELKMANNVVQQTVSFQTSEDARTSAEKAVDALLASMPNPALGSAPAPAAQQGLYWLTTQVDVTSRAFWRGNNYAATTDGGYIIEYLGAQDFSVNSVTVSEHIFRITAMGRGQDGITDTIVQSIYTGP